MQKLFFPDVRQSFVLPCFLLTVNVKNMAFFPSQVKTSSLIYYSKFTLASFTDSGASGQRQTQSISEGYPA